MQADESNDGTVTDAVDAVSSTGASDGGSGGAR